jgi:hypothetical protein
MVRAGPGALGSGSGGHHGGVASRREAIMLWEQIAEEATARLVLMFTTPKWPDDRPVPLLYSITG